MTSLENVMVGAHSWTRHGFVAGALRLPSHRAEEREIRRRATEVLERVDLARISRQRAGTLSGGQQQMVAVGRALMADPDVLAVDELSLGLGPMVVADLARHLRELHRGGMAILLIEQNVRLAFDLCERAYVLESGRVVAEGACAELASSPQVARAYLGGLTGATREVAD
jgi:branched-chain amino acid transport system ATP-binding protein